MIIQKCFKIIEIGWLMLSSCLYTFLLKIKLSINGVSFGKGLRTFSAIPTIKISIKANKVHIGDYFTFNNYSNVSWSSKSYIQVCSGATLKIGNHSGVNGVMIYCVNQITIGNYVNIGGGTRIIDTDFHNLDWQKRRDPATNLQAKTTPIVIEDDVFIGTDCIVLKGVTIGARSIIAAGSVVTKNIPADCLAGGNPCRVIKTIKN